MSVSKRLSSQPNKNIENIEPWSKLVTAEPHTPIYKMHRYFARRPHNIFNLLVEHYSNPNDIVLDPFMGGGVTIVESLRLGRKVVGIDLDPIAWFVTKTEVMDVDLNELRKAFGLLEKRVKKEINELYKTKCLKCKKEVLAKWFEWSLVVECPNCKKEVILAQTKKIGKGKYECYNCGKVVPKSSKIIKEIPIRVGIECPYCQFNGDKPLDDEDEELIQYIDKNFDKIVKEKKLWFPQEEIPFGEKTQEAINLGYTHFFDLFTKRNLIALGLLLNGIENISNKNVRELLILAFSNSLRFATKLCFLAKEWRKGEPLEWAGHDYWPPSVSAEVNVWKYFVKCYKRVLKGKEYSKVEIGNKYKEAKSFEDLKKDKTCLLLNKSSTDLSEIPDASVDVVITDPPYGGNVQYSELSRFWFVWLKKLLGLKEPNISEEAVINKTLNKDINDYEELIYRVLKECHRILKPNRWLVMTFHNRDPNVWISLHKASHRAGFEEVSRTYQPPIQLYTTTLHQRANGSLLGDFIVSFKWREKPIEEKATIDLPEENKIIEICKKVIEFHFGATTSMLYRALIPMPFFYRIAVKDLVPIFKRHFVQRDGKWYLKEQFDAVGNLKPIEIIPAEQRIETLLRSFLLGKPKTMDEIMQILLTTLPTEEYVEYEEVNKVLHRIAKKVIIPQKNRKGWVIEVKKPLKKFIEKKIEVEEKISQYPTIKELINLGLMQGFVVHIGIPEQAKNPRFKRVSFQMSKNIYGMSDDVFEEIRNMDVVWLRENGKYIDSVFEVEVSAIDRELHKLSNLILNTDYNPKIKTYLIVPDKKKDYAIKTINSPTFNRISKIVKIKTFSEVKKGEI
jgi:DNA modification methylase/DNA-directed RNA polymerase subunit RPC12/RpoP